MTTPFDDVPELSDPSPPLTMTETTQILGQMVRQQYDGRVVPQDVIQTIVSGFMELAIREALRAGVYRLPSGWGTFKLSVTKGSKTPRTVPNGVGLVPREPTVRVSYVGGLAFEDLLHKQVSRPFLFASHETPSKADIQEAKNRGDL